MPVSTDVSFIIGSIHLYNKLKPANILPDCASMAYVHPVRQHCSSNAVCLRRTTAAEPAEPIFDVNTELACLHVSASSLTLPGS